MPEARSRVWQRSTPLPLDPQVGLDDSLILLDVLRPALGDQTSVVENEDLLGDAHHQLDVVLDEKHGDARSVDVADALDQVGTLGGVHTGGGLVEQQQPRFGRQGAGDLHQTLRAVGKTGGGQMRRRLQPDGGEGLHGPFPRPLLFSPLMRQTESAGPQSGALVPMAADENVLEHGHVGVDAQVLEGAGHAETGGVRGREMSDIPAGETYGTRGQLLQPADRVEERRLAGPVRADERDDPSGRHLKRDLIDGFQAPEVDGEVLDLQEESRRGTRPRADPEMCEVRRRRLRPRRLESRQQTRATATSCSFSLLNESLETGPLIGPKRKPSGQEDQEEDHDDGVDDSRVLLDAREPVDDPGHDDGPDHRAPDRPAPEHHHHDREDGGA